MSLVFVFRFQYRKLSSQYLKGMNERKVVHERASPPGKATLGLGKTLASHEQNCLLRWDSGFWGPHCLAA